MQVLSAQTEAYIYREHMSGLNTSSLTYALPHVQDYGRMTEPEAAHAAHDILQVLSECHAQGICYADVKPANFLLKRPYSRKNPTSHPLELRVADFGCSQRLQEVCMLLPCPWHPLAEAGGVGLTVSTMSSACCQLSSQLL